MLYFFEEFFYIKSTVAGNFLMSAIIVSKFSVDYMVILECLFKSLMNTIINKFIKTAIKFCCNGEKVMCYEKLYRNSNCSKYNLIDWNERSHITSRKPEMETHLNLKGIVF